MMSNAAKFENHSLEKLTIGLGLMCTIKPLVQCFQTFTKLKTLVITNISFSKLHFMAIDNFIVSNQCLQKLVLICMNITPEIFKLMSESISKSKSLKSLNLSHNSLKDAGAL